MVSIISSSGLSILGLVVDATPSTDRLFAIHALGLDPEVSYLDATDPS